jgi:hypothetical protein
MFGPNESHRLQSGAALVLLATLTACGRQPRYSPNVPDVPVYPGAELVEHLDQPNRDPLDTYTVPSIPNSIVLDWYRQQMPKDGWTATSDESDTVVLYRNKAGCYAFIMAVQDQNGRDVMLQVSQQRPGSVCLPYTPAPPGKD